MIRKVDEIVSDEMLAAFLDAKTSTDENRIIMDALVTDPQLREFFHIINKVDTEMRRSMEGCEFLPMTAMAASCEEGAYCCMECEKFIMERLGIEYDEEKLMEDAVRGGWSEEDGMPLFNVGRHLENIGLSVTRNFNSSVSDIVKALAEGKGVIVAVDGGELVNNRVDELLEDILIGPIPDHTVAVVSVDEEKDLVGVYDPNSPKVEDVYPMHVFQDAWDDSKNYLVTVGIK